MCRSRRELADASRGEIYKEFHHFFPREYLTRSGYLGRENLALAAAASTCQKTLAEHIADRSTRVRDALLSAAGPSPATPRRSVPTRPPPWASAAARLSRHTAAQGRSSGATGSRERSKISINIFAITLTVDGARPPAVVVNKLLAVQRLPECPRRSVPSIKCKPAGFGWCGRKTLLLERCAG
jgi:hypothetical protein